MLKNLKKIIIYFFICLSFSLLSCAKKDPNIIKNPEKTPPLEELYTSAFKAYEDGDWIKSIKLFQKVETRYSFTEWAPRASLMIIYMYYETNDSLKTLEYIKKFKEQYPIDQNQSYVNFIKALTFYEQINVTSRDQTYAEVAMKEFKNILKKYPNSIYAEESRLKIDLIKEQLAGKHMYIARYYMQKSRWISAIKRLNIILNEYQSTVYIVEALHRLVEVYYKLGNIKEAKKYASILGYNFNDSDWYKKSYVIISDKDYQNEIKKTKGTFRDKIRKIFKFSK